MRKMLTIILVTAGAAALTVRESRAQAGDVAVVISGANRTTALSKADLRNILSGERRAWPGGQPIKLFIRAPGALERITYLKLLGMTEQEYSRYWSAQVFQGKVQSEPIALYSNGMQKEALATYPGGIALIGIRDLHPGMKVVKIDGYMPGDSGYPIY